MTSNKPPSVLALIPARGGSKGLPRKNILALCGRPLIAWTIDAALKAQHVDRVIVSTEDPEIAEVARNHGAEVPFMRPIELAQDNTLGMDVQIHALQWLRENENYEPEYSLVLQPTSPLRTSEDIDGIVEMAVNKNALAAIGLIHVNHHPYLMKCMDAKGRITPFVFNEMQLANRQSLPNVYAPNGALFLAKTALILERQTMETEQTYGYIMPTERSVDIDSQWDLDVAEMALQRQPPFSHSPTPRLNTCN